MNLTVQNLNGSILNILTLNLVVEISAFRMSGSYFVLDEEPENTYFKKNKTQHNKHLTTFKPLIISMLEEYSSFQTGRLS